MSALKLLTLSEAVIGAHSYSFTFDGEKHLGITASRIIPWVKLHWRVESAANKTSQGYLFVAINRATRRVFIAMYRNKTTANAWRFLGDLERTCPILIRTILTGNGKALTDRLFSVRRRTVTRQHAGDMLCSTPGIEHRLTPSRPPQTNGMVERFNGRLKDVLQSHYVRLGQELGTTLHC